MNSIEIVILLRELADVLEVVEERLEKNEVSLARIYRENKALRAKREALEIKRKELIREHEKSLNKR